MTFLHQHLLDDLARLGLREAALAQEIIPVFIGPRYDLLSRGLDAIHKAHRRGVGEARQRRGRFMCKTGSCIFRVADFDFLKILDAPKIAILANGAQIEAGDAQRLCANLGVPAVKAPEVEIGGAIRQPARLDRVVIVHQEQEDITVRGIKRGGVAADLDIRVVNPGRPVEHARHFPARIAGAVARNALYGLDQFMVMDAPIVGASHRTQFGTAIFGLKSLDLLCTVVGQPVLQIDSR